ncbi:MAG: hypothetical protein GY953_25655, partial [bacterium]|nr:hypothetical protein [bacterium]
MTSDSNPALRRSALDISRETIRELPGWKKRALFGSILMCLVGVVLFAFEASAQQRPVSPPEGASEIRSATALGPAGDQAIQPLPNAPGE